MLQKLKLWYTKLLYIENPLLLIVSISLAVGLWAWIKVNVGVE